MHLSFRSRLARTLSYPYSRDLWLHRVFWIRIRDVLGYTSSKLGRLLLVRAANPDPEFAVVMKKTTT
jgi:hypothetical protein